LLVLLMMVELFNTLLKSMLSLSDRWSTRNYIGNSILSQSWSLFHC